jgi:undecaprenyl-diphosphatase
MRSDTGDFEGGRRSGWDRVGVIDWPIAHALALRPDRRWPVAAAKAMSRLGNGPIYAPLVALVIVLHPHEAAAIILCAAISILLLHCVYPLLKRATARPRPRDVAPNFADSVPPLDKYSFPSGHVMTLTAALTPVVHAAPRMWPFGLVVWAAMAWSRLATGDHYASDVAAGTAMGAAVSGLLTYWIAS